MHISNLAVGEDEVNRLRARGNSFQHMAPMPVILMDPSEAMPLDQVKLDLLLLLHLETPISLILTHCVQYRSQWNELFVDFPPRYRHKHLIKVFSTSNDGYR